MGFDMPVRTYPELIYDTCPVCREPSLTGHHRIYTTIIDDCNICKNTIDEPYTLSCGHLFCKQCIVA